MASFVTVINEIEPDVLVVQEIDSQFGVEYFSSLGVWDQSL